MINKCDSYHLVVQQVVVVETQVRGLDGHAEVTTKGLSYESLKRSNASGCSGSIKSGVGEDQVSEGLETGVNK